MGVFNKKYRGFFNKYHKKMPFGEIVLKDLNYLSLSVKNFFRNDFMNKSILVYPHYPSRGSTVYKVGNLLGYNVTNKPKKSTKTAVYWEYLTFREEFQKMEEISKTKKVINLYSRDISKKFIDKIHQDVFGYATIVDPLIYNDKIVRKNDINAKHDGVIIQGPLSAVEDEFIYQRLIDNSCANNLVMDIRIPVVMKTLDFVYIKLRSIDERFKNTTVDTKTKNIDEILNQEEIELINEYCSRLKLEYGELDVLRDKKDGKIYVVDVNNTPQGPPANTSKNDSAFALQKLASAFEKLSNS
tara:strand:+ start:1201 stop:2097 length:897 start_codon:yes stop_codon:yes gene_type:complete